MRRITTGVQGGPVLGQFTALDNNLKTIPNNTDIIIDPNGTGEIKFGSHAQVQAAGTLKFNDSDNSNYVGLTSPATVSSNVTFTLPAADGTAGQFIQTDASGNLTFTDSGINIGNDTTSSSTFYPNLTTATSGKITSATVSSSKLSFQPSTGTLSATVINGGSVDSTNNITAGNVSKSSDTAIRSLAGDSNKCGFEAYGSNQGTGYTYVGQSDFASGYGGGMFYNGDGSPAFASGEAADYNCFYRNSAGTKTVTARYYYNDNNWYFHGHVLPNGTSNDLGASGSRWRNIYTNDLQLSNGIGDYTIVEGEEDLFIYNNKNGKTYKFMLQEVDPSIVPAKADTGDSGEADDITLD